MYCSCSSEDTTLEGEDNTLIELLLIMEVVLFDVDVVELISLEVSARNALSHVARGMALKGFCNEYSFLRLLLFVSVSS